MKCFQWYVDKNAEASGLLSFLDCVVYATRFGMVNGERWVAFRGFGDHGPAKLLMHPSRLRSLTCAEALMLEEGLKKGVSK